MAIPRLVHRDAVDPRAQAGLSSESMDGAEHAQEDFLGKVERFIPVAEQVDGQLNDHTLMLADEIGARDLVARCAPLHERRLTSADVRPPDDSCLFH
jgi:hypothetical protein